MAAGGGRSGVGGRPSPPAPRPSGGPGATPEGGTGAEGCNSEDFFRIISLQ